MTDWKAEVAQRKDDLMADLQTMLAVPSVRDDSKATDDAPLGPGPKAGLEAFLAIAKRDGFRTKNIDNVVGYVEVGDPDAAETLAVLAHVDVMPAGNSWDTDPFTPTIKDGRLYARGALDDKGPGMAAYYGLKIVSELGLPLNRKIRFIVGTDEESDWTGMHRYFEVEPAPTLGFSPDAEFPIINGEKGNITLTADFTGQQDVEANNTLVSFVSGERDNMVPAEADAVVTSSDNEALVSAFTAFLDAAPVTGEVIVDGDGVKLHVDGKASHGAWPENGINAGTYLGAFLASQDFSGVAADFLNFITADVHDDTVGDHLGLKITDEVMGALSLNIGILRFADQAGSVTLNFRFPKNTSAEVITESVAKAAAENHGTATAGRAMVPHYVPADDPLVQTLLNVYHDQTGLPAKEEVVGGGTYGRLMKRGVAFGAMFPGTPDTMHQPNEFIPVDDLYRAAAIYAQGIAELAAETDA
ncbi:dipeptidase PepV [Furfurilactobacillus siliginis]|uniref:Dipeptidase n=1 Tax=Furfurilactobacillus siliginis TaxID=348151 RepID=A0A0R2KW35_9LACO|nr:dipeptidase PepV [Furfurilactobacillus siliginis]KRN93678.1 dipeptidase [Furfurilactobacillus siliginis]GEK28383.1 dipeptidase PepV [Furfurilactobacillus siliginis]